jgi:uncharacterized protein
MNTLYLAVEFGLLFLALPVSLRYAPRKIPPLPLLLLAAGLCLLFLLRDASFDRNLLWNPSALGANLSNILITFALGAVILGASVYYFVPQLLFGFARTKPGLWALVMLLYPAFSVYPQGIIYRAFVMQRYQPVFGSGLGIVLASAVAFSLIHVVSRNRLAIVLTLVGGALFAWRYQTTGSLFVSCFEHALYGCFLFTIGLGRYFYARAI